MELEAEDKKRIAKAYRAFFAELMEEKSGSPLSDDELKAVGQKAIDDLIDRGFSNFDFSKEEKEEIKRQFEEFIREEYPGESLNSPLVYDYEGKSFSKK